MKKYIITAILMLLFHLGNAQNINTSLAADINAKFAPLEKNRIPHNILLDYGFDLIDVSQFDGVLRTNNYMDVERYNLIYNSIVSSATQINVSGIAPPKQELNEWKVLQKQQNDIAKFNNKAAVVLNGLFFNYSKINGNALANNKIVVVNDKYDDKYINGVWQNPYDNKQAFAITSSVIMLNKSTVDVVLPATLWHTNASVTEIAIDFGNSTGYKILTNGAVASTTYTAEGVYTWTYRILTNGQYKYCRQKVKVNQADARLLARNPNCPEEQPIPILASKAYQGIRGSATIQIARAGDNCGELRNPLIVVEGLDTGLLGQGGTIGDTDINSFFRSIFLSGSLELADLTINNTAVDYDIIYVNWNNGTDFIQRNAYVLEAVIAWVNDNKTGTNKNVILGQSMGGLIARYALRDMENTGLNHDTSLYISHDAPHQGAHIPLGMLFMARDVVNEFIQTPLGNISIPVEGVGSVGLGTIDDLLDAPAINQMLINNVDTNGNRTNTVHTNWQNELRNFGYPRQTRNIALSNASHCASGQGLLSNQELVTVAGNGGTSDLTSLLMFVFLPVDPLIGVALNDVSAALLGFLPGNSSLDLEIRANAFPSSGTARIYKGRLTYKKTFLWLIPITRTIFNNSEDSLTSDKFIDNYPGGVTPNALAISEGGGDSNWFYNYNYELNVNLNFNFISATSALDVGSGNAILTDTDYFKIYTAAVPPTGNTTIPFANFSTSFNTSNINEAHISFNRRNGDWLASELDTDVNNVEVFNCSFICENSVNISGPAKMCTNGSIYSINLPSIIVPVWSITQGSNLVTLTTNSNGSVTLTSSQYSGTITLSATFGNINCGFRTLEKTITIGNNSTNFRLTIVDQYCANNFHYYVLRPINSPTNFDGFSNFTPNAGIFTTPFNGANDVVFRVPGNYVGNASFSVLGSNSSCGKFKYTFTIGSIYDCQFIQLPRMSQADDQKRYYVYPNPSKNVVYVSLNDAFKNTSTKTTINAELFDLFAVSKGSIRILDNSAVLDVSGLSEGIYILKIYLDDTIESHQIIVQ